MLILNHSIPLVVVDDANPESSSQSLRIDVLLMVDKLIMVNDG